MIVVLGLGEKVWDGMVGRHKGCWVGYGADWTRLWLDI